MMRWARSTLMAGVILALSPLPVEAHPLGNFTINHFSRVVIGEDRISVRYVIDMAEIPAFQERNAIDGDNDDETDAAEVDAYLDRTVPALIDGLRLVVGGSPLPLVLESRELTFPPGQGGLSTLRLVLDLTTEMVGPTGAGSFENANYDEQIGWREIVVKAGPGIALEEASVGDVGLSDELRAYPPDLLDTPPDMRSASFSFGPGTGEAGDLDPAPGVIDGRPDDPLASLVGGTLSPLYIALAFALSIGLGAVHGVSPGHGKTLVAAYLIGSQGTLRQGIWLGMIVAVTHTAGVFVLGALTLAATELIVPQRVIEWLSLITGVAVIILGISLLVRLRSGVRPGSALADETGVHAHGHDHSHPHHHSHGASGPLPPLSGRSLVALGLLGGLVPSGSALIVLLLGVTLDRIAFGIALILAFGVGMAIVLAAISVSVVVVRKRSASREGGWLTHPLAARAATLLPSLTALAALVTGILLTVQAVRSVV